MHNRAKITIKAIIINYQLKFAIAKWEKIIIITTSLRNVYVIILKNLWCKIKYNLTVKKEKRILLYFDFAFSLLFFWKENSIFSKRNRYCNLKCYTRLKYSWHERKLRYNEWLEKLLFILLKNTLCCKIDLNVRIFIYIYTCRTKFSYFY